MVVSDNAVHFFEKHSLGGETSSFDMQRIDVGIGICHFHLAVLENNMSGYFERKAPDVEIPAGMTYVVSWVRD